MDIPISQLPKPIYPPITKKKIVEKKEPKSHPFLDDLLPKTFKEKYFNKK